MTQIKVDTVTNAAGTGNPDFADGLTYEGSATSTLNLCEYTSSASEPSSPKNGALWYDTGNSVTKIYANGAWNELTAASGSSAVWYGDRGVFAGESVTIDYIDITTTGNATDFGDLAIITTAVMFAVSNGTRGVFGGGSNNLDGNTIQYITIATASDTTDFGDLSTQDYNGASASNGTRGLFAGGANQDLAITYITIDTTGNPTDFGDLTVDRATLAGCSDGTYGVFGGGQSSNVIDYVTIDTTGNATDFGDLIQTTARQVAACSDATYGCWGGGNTTVTRTNEIQYVTIQTPSNATDFGDLTVARREFSATSNNSRGVFGGGDSTSNVIDYITIASPSNATDFGDLTVARENTSALSGAAS